VDDKEQLARDDVLDWVVMTVFRTVRPVVRHHPLGANFRDVRKCAAFPQTKRNAPEVDIYTVMFLLADVRNNTVVRRWSANSKKDLKGTESFVSLRVYSGRQIGQVNNEGKRKGELVSSP